MNQNKRQLLGGGGGGRFSYAPNMNIKTPTRARLTYNSHTPSARVSTSTRFSIGAQSAKRLSIFRAPNISAIPKDTNDKSVQIKMVKKIYNFLVQNDGDEAVAECKVMSPQQKDFILIFEQIYECISQDYEYPKERKIVEEIPRIFSELGYPFGIKTSTLQTIGASHSWHYLLHALCWLVDFVQKPMNITVGPQILLAGDDENQNLKAFRMSWCARGFHEYQKNQNVLEYNDFIEKSIKQVKDYFENNENINGHIISAENHLKTIKNEIETLKGERGNEEKHREDIRETEDDFKKLTVYVNEMQKVEAIEKAAKEAEEAITQKIKAEVEMLKEKVAKINLAIIEQEKTKGIKADQAKVIMSEHNQLKHQLRETQSELERLSKEQWINQPKSNEAFSQIMSQSRKIINVIKNVGESVNYTFKKFDENSLNSARDLHSALNNELRVEYEAIRDAIRDVIHTTEKETKGIENKIVHTENRRQMEAEKLADLQRRLQKKYLRNQQFTEEAKNERKKEANIIEKLEMEKEVLLNRKKGVVQLQKELEETEYEYLHIVQEAQVQREQFENKIKDSAKFAMEAISAIRNEKFVLEKTMKAHLEDWINVCPVNNATIRQ